LVGHGAQSVIYYLILFINAISQLLVLLVIVSVILSYFMDPYHPVRRAIDGVIEPMLAPIRRVVPLVGMLDFSPLILLILIQVVSRLIIRLLLALSGF
jgi:YggT family protein